MPGKGVAYRVDDEWRRRVRAELKTRGWSQAELARRISVAPSVVSELLSGRTNQSPIVPDVHRVFDWSAPPPPVLEEDAQHLIDIYLELDAAGRARLLERAMSLYEIPRKKLPSDVPGDAPAKKPR